MVSRGDVPITLTWAEVQLSAMAGVQREIYACKGWLNESHGHDRDKSWQDHITGAIGERVVAKWRDRYFHPRAGVLGLVDVGPYEVRATERNGGKLILRPGDAEDRPWILVTGKPCDFVIRGWILGRDGMRDEWWRTDIGGRPPAWFVPQAALAEPATLPSGSEP